MGEIKRYMLSKRYESLYFGTQYEHMEPNPNGDYVRVYDHDREIAQRDARIGELQSKLADHDMMCGAAMAAIREACAEIMGGNCAFIDDDFARCLYTMKSERDTARAQLLKARGWMNHGPSCGAGNPSPPEPKFPCTCGLDQFLAELPKEQS